MPEVEEETEHAEEKQPIKSTPKKRKVEKQIPDATKKKKATVKVTFTQTL